MRVILRKRGIVRLINMQEALDLLRRAVAEKGEDYVYVTPSGERAGNGASCVYFHGDEPGCIVGHLLHYVGLTRDDLRMPGVDCNAETCIVEPELIGILRECNVEFTDEALTTLSAVQGKQDSGTPWGQCVREVDERFQ